MNARQMGENEKLQKELQDVKKDISEMKGDSRKLRNTFLLGSLGYNIVDVAREYVFGKAQLKLLRRKLATMDDIELAEKSTREAELWMEFKTVMFSDNLKWNEDWLDIIHEITSFRVGPAHPTKYDEKDEDVISPKQLQSVATAMYNSRASTETRTELHNMVTFLDQITRRLGRPLLL